MAAYEKLVNRAAMSRFLAKSKQTFSQIGHAHDFTDVDTVGGEACYPTFARASWSTSSDESALPVTPCFVLDTSDGGLYWCDGE